MDTDALLFTHIPTGMHTQGYKHIMHGYTHAQLQGHTHTHTHSYGHTHMDTHGYTDTLKGTSTVLHTCTDT